MNARQLEPPLVRRPSIRAAARLITPLRAKRCARAPNWACRVCEVKRIFPVIALVMIESENHLIVKPRFCCLRVV
jgi:hypothetical protein